MGDFFRSEPMLLCQLFIQPEAAYHTVSELGELGTVQFRDLNNTVNSFQKKYASEVKRCSEMERQLTFIESEMTKDGVNIPVLAEAPKALHPREIINLEAHLEKTEKDIEESCENATELKTEYLQMMEMKHVLENTEQILSSEDRNRESVSRVLFDEESGGRLSFVAGVVDRERVPGFERMLWRISRGNVFVRQMPVNTPFEDPRTGANVYKTVFCAFFQGDQLKSRLMKVCAGYRASVYPVPSSSKERNSVLADLKTRLADLNIVMNQTKDHRARILVTVSQHLRNWIVMVRKMKAIYHTLNMFNVDVSKKCMISECWIPVRSVNVLRDALREGASVGGSSIPSFYNILTTNETPPTYNKTNKFTAGFQNLIDSYGIASYKEVNPALYTIITFPFLFAVMFGDAGHGLVVTIFAATLVLLENRLSDKKWGEIWTLFFGGRYMILMMGLFSIYTGFIYNDVFAKSVNIFGSKWHNVYNKSTILTNVDLQFNPTYSYEGTPYPFGFDPVWQIASNKIIFQNSYKMKLSIIIGVCHMLFGVTVGLVNTIYFRHWSRIFTEFIPHVLFLSCLIVYLVFMMFFKWFTYTGELGTPTPRTPACAPSILIMFINMILQKGTAPPKDCEEYMFENQKDIQFILFIIAMCCIPVMILGHPICVIVKRKFSKSEDTDEPMSDIWINQGIHTIEYCLNTISHTASYLRLWALSLAHAQLSEVIWNMILRMGFDGVTYTGFIMLYILFAAWACLSASILILMEGLSAFLHTLRLHWVEFMSKFYEGLGEQFTPFCFKTLMEVEDAED